MLAHVRQIGLGHPRFNCGLPQLRVAPDGLVALLLQPEERIDIGAKDLVGRVGHDGSDGKS